MGMENEFVELVTQHQALIYKVCHLYADKTADIEGLFQEIVVNLWQAYPRFDGRAKITTWMYRVAGVVDPVGGRIAVRLAVLPHIREEVISSGLPVPLFYLGISRKAS